MLGILSGILLGIGELTRAPSTRDAGMAGTAAPTMPEAGARGEASRRGGRRGDVGGAGEERGSPFFRVFVSAMCIRLYMGRVAFCGCDGVSSEQTARECVTTLHIDLMVAVVGHNSLPH